MKPLQPGNKRTKKICLLVTFLAGLAGLFSLALFFGPELKAQNQQRTANSHDQTSFPLQGRHRSISCAECHLKGVLEGTPGDCEACHWLRKQDDPYKLYFGNHCADCHTPFAWKILKPNSWNHGQATGFSLAGIHKTMDCINCHKNNVFSGQPSDCYSCHRRQYENAPGHVSANYSTDCRQCHFSMVSWSGAQTDHSSFSLLGRHKTAICTDCHKNNIYAGTPRECVDCHLQDYNSTRNPNHKLAGYSTDCVSCHGGSAQTWNNAVVNHDQYWPLQGAHKNLDCSKCHASGYNLPTDCYGCHKKDYDATTNPDHKLSGFPFTCENCHFANHLTWNQAVFNHDQYWLLQGAHKNLDCSKCHASGYNLPTDCYGCHKKDYDATTNPDHKLSGFPFTCENCHFANHLTWNQAVFNHDQYWPLQGAHKNLDCSKCHASGYNLPTDCYGCHKKDYDATANPNHKQAGYSTACQNCHFSSHTSWNQAVFSHNFPIKSGKHAGFSCTDCHLSSNYLVFSCIDCHAHTKSSMDSKHDDVHGYSYNSQACYTCHPRGIADN